MIQWLKRLLNRKQEEPKITPSSTPVAEFQPEQQVEQKPLKKVGRKPKKDSNQWKIDPPSSPGIKPKATKKSKQK